MTTRTSFWKYQLCLPSTDNLPCHDGRPVVTWVAHSRLNAGVIVQEHKVGALSDARKQTLVTCIRRRVATLQTDGFPCGFRYGLLRVAVRMNHG